MDIAKSETLRGFTELTLFYMSDLDDSSCSFSSLLFSTNRRSGTHTLRMPLYTQVVLFFVLFVNFSLVLLPLTAKTNRQRLPFYVGQRCEKLLIIGDLTRSLSV